MKQRSLQLNIHLTPQEQSALKSAAKRHGYRGVGEYLRAVALSGKAPTEYTYTVVVHPGEKDEGGFWAEVPALPGCNTQGETYEQTIEHAREAIEGYLKMLIKRGEAIPTEKQPRRKITTAIKVAV